jgi:CRP/FNR family transcriptional regulator, cyclic AMP receptor protein
MTLGEVRVTIYSSVGKAVSFRELAAGEIFGEFPAIDGGSRSASVEARTNCLIALPRPFARLQLGSMSSVPWPSTTVSRPNCWGWRASGPRKAKTPASCPPQPMSRSPAASAPHREAVTRELNRLSRIGIIERRGGTLLVKDTDRLSEMVQCPPPGQAKQEPLGRNRASRDSQGCGLQAPQYGGTP